MTIRAVTFDLWNTLLAHPAQGGMARHEVRVQALREALRARGTPVDADAISETMKAEWRHYDEVWHRDARTMQNVERVVWMVEALGAEALDEATCQRVADAFDQSIWAGPPALADGALACLSSLSAAGVAMGVISDTSFTTGKTLRVLLERHGALEHLAASALVFSDEVGASKPRRELFERALDALGSPAAATAHVGDNPHTDVHGARAAGLRAVYYGDRDDVAADVAIGHFDELLPALGLA